MSFYFSPDQFGIDFLPEFTGVVSCQELPAVSRAKLISGITLI
jgi:hypothetical protein